MTDFVLSQHAPAMKVGGRRLSISKSKAHPSLAPAAILESTAVQGLMTDYPRPTRPSDHDNPPHHDEVPVPKKDRNFEKEQLQQLQGKMEQNRPTRDAQATSKAFGAGGRISQPEGKVL